MSRFSQLYLDRGKATRDNVRFRRRLAAYFSETHEDSLGRSCINAYQRETGAEVKWSSSGLMFSSVFRDAEIRDVLDAITVVYDVLRGSRYSPTVDPMKWRAFVARVLHEENVGYRVDQACVVHFHVDEEFERNRAAALSTLELPQLQGVRAAFEDAYRHLDADPQDAKASVRSMFEAVEMLAKLIVPSAERLTRSLCVQKLKDAVLAVSPQDQTQQESMAQSFASLGYWVEAAHEYRHGQRSEEAVAPSEDYAVLLVSTGTAHLRHLAGCAEGMPHLAERTS
jgi:hypothetical protein